MMKKSEHEIISAHFFFVDIVGLSKPFSSTKTQIKKIDTLQDCLRDCETYKNTPKESRLSVPTGDGLALGFFSGPHQPFSLAIELQQKLSEYNKGKIPSDVVETRIGLHSGTVYVINDIHGNKNVWGPGIILAHRVMDLGDAGHILLTSRIAKDLSELSDEYGQVIHEIQDFVIKHEQVIPVYSAYGEGFGNPNIPSKGIEQGIHKEISKLNKETFYPSLVVKIIIKDPKTMLIKYKRTYEVLNLSDKPITQVIHGIGTDVQKPSLEELKVKVYDEENKIMQVNKITMNYPFQKEFSTLFNKPIMPHEKGRKYTLEYEVEEPERFFENVFLVDCKIFEISLQYLDNSGINQPTLYQIDQETEQKTKSDIMPNIEKNNKIVTASWMFKNCSRGQTFRVEW